MAGRPPLDILELLAFNAHNLRGHVTLATPTVPIFFSGIMSGLSVGACLLNLTFVSLGILDLLAFNTHNLRGHVTLATPPFRKFFLSIINTFCTILY